jgi:hypothetical protein
MVFLTIATLCQPLAAQDVMPEGLLGKSREEAVKVLEESEIRYQVLYRNTCDFHLTVIESDPAEGEPFPDNLRFATITVTNGSAERVPKIVDLQPDTAQARLERQRLTFRVRDVIPEPADWCSTFRRTGGYTAILRQSPAVDAVVCPGTEVTGTRQINGYYVSQRAPNGMCL